MFVFLSKNPDLVLRNSSIYASQPTNKPIWKHNVLIYVPDSQSTVNNNLPFYKSHSKNFIAYIVLNLKTLLTAQPSAGGLYNYGAINIFNASIHLFLNSDFPILFM